MQLIVNRAAEQADYQMLLKSKFFNGDPRWFFSLQGPGGRVRQIWEGFSQAVAPYRSEGVMSWNVVVNPHACIATRDVPLTEYMGHVVSEVRVLRAVGRSASQLFVMGGVSVLV